MVGKKDTQVVDEKQQITLEWPHFAIILYNTNKITGSLTIISPF